MLSKSKGRKGKKSNGRKGQVKPPTRNWLDLPSDLMLNILKRVGAVDTLENAQYVCTAWHEICKDPAMWRVVYLDGGFGPNVFLSGIYEEVTSFEMCKHVVDRSQGQLIDLTLDRFQACEFLEYVADRASQLQRLELTLLTGASEFLRKAFRKLSLLKELKLVRASISQEDIEAAGRYCPLLKTLKVNQKACRWLGFADAITYRNEIAVAIGSNLPELIHLELIGNNMTNVGLQAILDGCCHLESLDLRRCLYVDLMGDLGKRCSQQIKNLKLPHESLEGYLHAYNIFDDDDSDDDDELYEYVGI